MASVGFEGAWGQQAMADSIRQRIIDALNQKVAEHGMSVEDQKLALEKQRFDQEAADRAVMAERGQITSGVERVRKGPEALLRPVVVDVESESV